MTKWFRCDRLFTGEAVIENALWSVAQQRITSLTSLSNVESAPQDCEYLVGTVIPGFIDVQVNGGGGVLFNHDTHLSGLRKLIDAHQQFGTTGLLPTVITEDLAVMQRAAEVVAEAHQQGLHNVLGIHFEGPHLSAIKPGIHPTHKIRPFTDAELALYTRRDLGCVMLTVAPEVVPVDIIRLLVKQGVIISLGHSNADADTVAAAFEAGASGVTHLFNAMSGLTARNPGMIGATLVHPHCFAGLIVDGFHVDALNVGLACQVMGAERISLVTDAMAHVGCEQKVFPYEQAEIIRQGNKLTLADGTLAGSALDMASAVRNTIAAGIAPQAAFTMATRTPARWLGLTDRGVLGVGAFADWCLMNAQFEIKRVFIKGLDVQF